MQRDPDLSRLDDLLLSLPEENDGMLLSEFDGLCAGVIVSPQLIPPSDWLPLVWGDEVVAPFETLEAVQEANGLVMAHYNMVAQSLMPPVVDYAPVFDVDQRSDETLWEGWASGFERAMRLRPESWEPLLQDEESKVAQAVNMMLVLAEIAAGESDVPALSALELTNAAPDLIITIVEDINAHVKAQTSSAAPPSPSMSDFVRADPRYRKTGRNDPCPCGSGRKYKKCCGAN